MARNFSALSAAYRGRLERAGITRAEYEAGSPLHAARGHGSTPERPERALLPQNAGKYKAYVDKRAKLTNEVALKKRQLFQGSGIWKNVEFNAKDSLSNVRSGPVTKKPPSMARMQKFLDLGEDLFNDPDFDWGDDEWDFLYYH